MNWTSEPLDLLRVLPASLQLLQIRVPHIIPSKLFPVPTQHVICPTCYLWLVRYMKSITSILFFFLGFSGWGETESTWYVGHCWPIVPAPGDRWWWLWSRGNRSTRRKPAPVPLCPPQIPHDLTGDRTRAAAVGSQRLTAWAMARPLTSIFVYHPYFAELLSVYPDSMPVILTGCLFRVRLFVRSSLKTGFSPTVYILIKVST
jgi:hypothetical protein